VAQSDNILVAVNYEDEIVALAIGDYDSARRCTKHLAPTPRGHAVGTIGWQAPEIEDGNLDLVQNQAVDSMSLCSP
jgi:hypothetical protein